MTPETLLNELWLGALDRLGGSAAIEACARQTGGRKKAPPLALRLVAFRKPAAAAEISRATARRAKGGNAILGGTLAAAEWVIPATFEKRKR